MQNEFLVPSTDQNSSIIYTVNSEIGMCTCSVGISGAPCKHQGAVAVKFNISIFNFLPSLTPDDRMLYGYVALGYTARESSFYASLNGKFVSQHHEDFQATLRTSNNSINEINETSNNDSEFEETDVTAFDDFLNEIKEDYQNATPQLCTALNKFVKYYRAAKSQSIPRLTSFLYDLNDGADPTARIKSSSMIRVQVESVK